MRRLVVVIERFDGGPVGVESLAAAIGEERGTIEDVLEPFLHLGLAAPPRPDQGVVGDLFGNGDH